MHLVKITLPYSTTNHLPDYLLSWLEEFIGPSWDSRASSPSHYWDNSGQGWRLTQITGGVRGSHVEHYDFLISDAKDAMLFKLVWGGK